MLIKRELIEGIVISISLSETGIYTVFVQTYDSGLINDSITNCESLDIAEDIAWQKRMLILNAAIAKRIDES